MLIITTVEWGIDELLVPIIDTQSLYPTKSSMTNFIKVLGKYEWGWPFRSANLTGRSGCMKSLVFWDHILTMIFGFGQKGVGRGVFHTPHALALFCIRI